MISGTRYPTPRASFSSYLLFGPTLSGTSQNLTLWAEAAGRQVKRVTVAPATRRRLEASAPAYSGRLGTSGRARGDRAKVPARVTTPREEARASPWASQPAPTPVALSGNEEREGGGALQAAAKRKLGGAGRVRSRWRVWAAGSGWKELGSPRGPESRRRRRERGGFLPAGHLLLAGSVRTALSSPFFWGKRFVLFAFWCS